MTEKRKRALIDVDGVLADFITPALLVATSFTGKPYNISDFHSWDIFDVIGKEFEKECFEVYKTPGWCSHFKPYPGTQDAIANLEEYMDVYVVTSPMNGPTWVHDRTQWLWDHFGIPSKRVIHTSAKYAVVGDLFIDDKPEHVEDWSDAHPAGMPVLWAQPYNRQPLRITRPYIHTSSWADVLWHVEHQGL